MLLHGCESSSKNVDLIVEEHFEYDSMLVQFNDFFRSISPDEERFIQFDEISFETPNFPSNFYSSEELEAFHFFTFYNDRYESAIAIKKDSILPYHEVYSLTSLDTSYYIDFSNNIHADFSFIQNYGFEIYSADEEFSGIYFTINQFDSRLIGKWRSDSTQDVKNLEFEKELLLIGETQIEYLKSGDQVLNSVDSTLLLKIIGLSNSHLTVLFNQDEDYKIQRFIRHSSSPTEE